MDRRVITIVAIGVTLLVILGLVAVLDHGL